MKTITVKIKPDASVEVDANGFTGRECLNYTKPLIDKIAGHVDMEEYKPEFYQDNFNASVTTISTTTDPDDAA